MVEIYWGVICYFKGVVAVADVDKYDTSMIVVQQWDFY